MNGLAVSVISRKIAYLGAIRVKSQILTNLVLATLNEQTDFCDTIQLL